MLRLASSTVSPNALRAIASSRILSGFITNYSFSGSTQEYSLVRRESPNCYSHHFSTEAKKQLLDRRLVTMLKSEIKSTKLSLEKPMPLAPADFPFTIEDDPCERNINLTREFDGEKIDILVEMPSSIPEDDEDEIEYSDTDISDDETNVDGDGGGDDDSSSTDSDSVEEKENSGADAAPSLDLIVKISKENGKEMEIRVSASADEVKMNSVSVKERASESDGFGLYSLDIDSDLQFDFENFLESRGIRKSDVGFLHKYMVRKSKQHPMLALKELKKFIKE